VSKTFLVQGGDAVYGSNRQPVTTQNGAKLKQDLAEMLSINIQPDGFGAGIVQVLGLSSQLDNGQTSDIEFILRDRLTSATNRFIGLQKKNVTNRSLDELVKSVTNLQVQQNQNDPTMFFWRADWYTFAGTFQSLKGRILA
jgi:hypothetical protein